MSAEKDVKMVTTIDGSIHPQKNCRRMGGVYYLKGDVNVENSGHCYYFKESKKYFKYNTGYITYDHNLKRYVLSSGIEVENGIVGLKDEKPIFGAFSKPLHYVPVYAMYEGKLYNCISREVFKDSFVFKESLVDGIYYDRRQCDTMHFYTPSKVKNDYKNSLQYNCSSYLNKAVKLYNELNPEVEPSSVVRKENNFFHDYTFGFEFETIRGNIPHDICNKLGLIPLRDGSIGGLEFVTIPLSGERGIKSLIESLEELQKRTSYGDDCSLHLHIGNIPRTEQFLLAFFRLICLVEDELFSMFPIYKRENYGIKKKCYTNPFPLKKTMFLMDQCISSPSAIKRNFGVLFDYLSMGNSYRHYDYDLMNVTSHPSDPGNNGKWNIKTRYHHINLIPIIFGNKQTIEFRIHTPTYSVDKIINYLILCTSLLEFTRQNQTTILNDIKNYVDIGLYDIVCSVNKSKGLQKNMYEYLGRRKRYIIETVMNGEIKSPEQKMRFFNSYPILTKDVPTFDSTLTSRFSYAINNNNFEPVFNHLEMLNQNQFMNNVPQEAPGEWLDLDNDENEEEDDEF